MNLKHNFFVFFGITLFGLLGIYYYLIHGVPLHDFRLWKLERSYEEVSFVHPLDSVLIERKTYIGGPSEHGAQSCTYAVGDVRTIPRSSDQVLLLYDELSIDPVIGEERIPLNVLFSNPSHLPLHLPFTEWHRDLQLISENYSGTTYFVSVSIENQAFLGDFRCDH